MQILKFKKIIIAVMAVIAVTLGSFSIINLSPIGANAETIEISSVIQSRVALNTEIDVPTTTSVEFHGEKTAKDGVIVCPDGKVINAGKIKFNQMGKYELRYYFDYLGVTHTAVQKVEVYSDYCNLSNPAGGEIIVSDEENPLYCGKDGIIVKLKSGTQFVYNKVLDLRECGEDGLSNIIELDGRYGHFDADGNYVPDVLEGWVRLTDCYNPNLYIELRMQKSVNYTGCLFPGVKTNCQPVTGMDKGVTQVLGSSRIINLDGINYRVWMTEGSMNVGMYNMKTVMTTGAVWKYDMSTNRVYLSYNDGENFLVTDLDEPLIYTNGNYFPGFTTGEVFVSIYANGYESTYANTEIVSIGNDNLKDVVGKEYVDCFAPMISVNQEKTTKTGVYGAVGDTFTIPSATATDVNLVGDIDVAVYRGYGENNQTNVSVVDGKFTLSESDLYTIVYSARDAAGNIGKEIFTVSAIKTPDGKAITLNTLQTRKVKAGERIENLFEITNSINIDKQDVQVKISVENDRQKIEGEGEDFAFTPYFEGKYTVRYTYSDGVFSYEKVIFVQSEKSNNVCFMEEITVPKYFLKGEYYAIDNVSAYTFANGYPTPVNTEVYAVFDDGQEQKVDNTQKVKITGNNSVYFMYKSSNAETLITDKITIINADYYNTNGKKLGFDMSKFFIGDFSANALNSSGKRTKNITYTSNKLSGDNKLSYFNAISGRNFAVEYRVVANEDKFDTLRFTLTDSQNKDNKLYIEIFNREATYISVNGGALTKVEHIAFAGNLLTVSYDYDSKFVRVGDFSTSVNFDAKMVYLDVETLGITGKTSFIIARINNTSIAGNVYVDESEPEIYLYDFQGDYKEGDIVKVSVPEYSDVISGIDYSTAQMLITCADGQPVKDAKGNILTNLVAGGEYEILLDRIAKFYVIYQISDFGGREFRKTVTVNCADSTAPTIVLENIAEGETLKVKAHDEIEMNFTVSDNVSKPKDITVYIHLYCVDMFSYVPNVSNIQKVNAPEDGVYREKFVITIKGRYQALIDVMDAEGNRYVKYIDIIVE